VREVYISDRLAKYFSATQLSRKLGFLSEGATFVRVSDIRKLGGSNDVYSFSLTYSDTGYEQRRNFILKTYVKALEPVLKNNVNYKSFSYLSYTYPKLYCENLQRCEKEFQVLKGLEHVGFPVPSAYLCEGDSNVLEYPFIIMQNVQKEEPPQNSAYDIGRFAKNLARLHSLEVNTLGINALKAPDDTFAFARRSLLYFKILLKLLPRHNKELEKDFEFALHWLESNLPKTSCPNYCLLHGDYRTRLNTVLTKDSTMVVLDWESAEIGDPAYDVGYTYTRTRADMSEKTADRFVQEYLSHSDRDIVERLLFYKLVAHLRLAILHSSILSNPLTAYEIRGIKAFLFFPFLSLPYIAKKTRADWDTIWVECFKEFVGENFRR